MRVLSSLAFAAVLARMDVAATLLPTALLLPRIRAGEAADVALLTRDGVQALVAEGWLAGGSVQDLAVSSVGLAVKDGAPLPPIADEAALVRALRAAPSIGLSHAGASGQFFAALLRRLGIESEIMRKAVVIDSGYTAALLVENRVELAVQQVSELMMVPGVAIVGALPEACGGRSVFSGGVLARAAEPEAGAALLRRIAAARDVLSASGLAPV